MLVVPGAGGPSKILQDIYLAKLMARRRISFAVCYITFKTRFSFKEYVKSGFICWHLDLQVLRAGLWGNSYCCWMGSKLGMKTHILKIL